MGVILFLPPRSDSSGPTNSLSPSVSSEYWGKQRQLEAEHLSLLSNENALSPVSYLMHRLNRLEPELFFLILAHLYIVCE